MPLALVVRRLAFTGLALCFLVVVLGAYVRLSAAGLACPDWPGCYGAPTPAGIAPAAAAYFPHSSVDVGKAWREMLHRYAAATLGLLIVVLAGLAIARGGRRMRDVRFAGALLGILILQASLGMLTVTLRLTPLIVTLHLIFGMTTPEVRALQSQINSAFQHTGDNVLFVTLPARHMSAEELDGYSKKAPVLLVQLEAKTNELAVLYGYLAPVNAFGALTSD